MWGFSQTSGQIRWRDKSTLGSYCFLDQHSALLSAFSFTFTVRGISRLSGFCSAVTSPGSRAYRRLCSAEPVIECPSAFPLQGNVFAVTSFPVLFVLKDSFLLKSPLLSFLVGLKEFVEVTCVQPTSLNRKHSGVFPVLVHRDPLPNYPPPHLSAGGFLLYSTSVWGLAHTSLRMCVHVCVCMYIYIYIYIHI